MTVALLCGRYFGGEQKMGCVVDELGIPAMVFLELLKFNGEMRTDAAIAIPARVARKTSVKQFETANILDFEIRRDERAQLIGAEQVRGERDTTPVLEFHIKPIVPVILAKLACLLDRVDIDGRLAADRTDGRHKAALRHACNLGKYRGVVRRLHMIENAAQAKAEIDAAIGFGSGLKISPISKVRSTPGRRAKSDEYSWARRI